MQGLGSILTHHTTEASASIEYEIKGQVYVSSWNVSKARTGNLKDYEMSLMDNTGTYLDLKRSEVPAQNEEIIGLKYDQFVKSIILSQGEFSKFLKADKNERGQLLENLTGTSVYRKIGAKAFQKFKEVNESAKLEKARLEDIKVLTEEERAGITTSIEKTKQELTALDATLSKLETLEQVKRELISIKEELTQNASEKERLSAQAVHLKTQTDKLNLHEKLSSAAGELKLYGQTQKEIQESQDQISLKTKELSKTEELLKATLSTHQSLTGLPTSIKAFVDQLNTFEQEVLELDRQKTESRQKGIEQRNRINQVKTASDLNIGEKVGPEEALNLLSKQKDSLHSTLSQVGLSESSDVKEVRRNILTQRESNELLRDILQNLRLKDQSLKDQTILQRRLKEINEKVDQLIPLAEKSKTLLSELKEKETLLQQQKEDALRIASLEELRNDLKDDQPCPLCGATDHPFSAHKPEDLRPELDTKLNETRQKSIQEEEEFKQLSARLTTAETEHNSINTSLKEVGGKLASQEEALSLLTSQYKGSEELTSTHLESKLPALTHGVNQLEEAIHALDQLRINKELTQAFYDFKEITAAYKRVDLRRKEKFVGADIAAATKSLRDDFTHIQTRMTEIKSALSFEENRQTQAQTQLRDLKAQLSPLLSKYGFDSISALSAALLSEPEADQIRQQRERLTQQTTTNQAHFENLQKRQITQSELDTAPETTLESIVNDKITGKSQRDELAMLQGSNTEKIRKDNQDKKLVAGKAEALEKLNAEVQKWSLLNKMIGDAYGNKFSNFAQGLTLQNLLVYTNRRLTKLSDRYLLDKPTDDGALKVIDQYQGNSERSVSTLSGGETFLLSLALALSLSDMASKNVSLDSLFIDEGFGTLDQETLDVAMTTLERLQSESQKTVGVISHVEALKERINVQINLQKNAQGYSTIKVEG